METVGDCYVAATGLMMDDGSGFMQIAPTHDPVDSAIRMVEFAKGVLAHSRTVKMPQSDKTVTVGNSLLGSFESQLTHKPDLSFHFAITMRQVRIGIHTGPCVTGLIGSKLPKFSIFGDTINTASRMESTCVPGNIQISDSTWALVKDHDAWKPTGGIEVKGKGRMDTYLWEGDLPELLLDFTNITGSENQDLAYLPMVSKPEIANGGERPFSPLNGEDHAVGSRSSEVHPVSPRPRGASEGGGHTNTADTDGDLMVIGAGPVDGGQVLQGLMGGGDCVPAGGRGQ